MLFYALVKLYPLTRANNIMQILGCFACCVVSIFRLISFETIIFFRKMPILAPQAHCFLNIVQSHQALIVIA